MIALPKANVVDLFHGDNVPDIFWSNAAANGIFAVLHKATQGAAFIDPMYKTRREAASRAGLIWGAYHFGTGDDVTAQYRNFIVNSGAQPGDIVALDYEQNPESQMSPTQVLQFIDLLHQGGYKTVLYGSDLLAELPLFKSYILETCWIWRAFYPTSNDYPADWFDYPHWLWQFTEKGFIPGLEYTYDLNFFDGTRDEFLLWPKKEGTNDA